MLATQKHITLRALSVVLSISLCCIPLFGCDGVDPVELPPEKQDPVVSPQPEENLENPQIETQSVVFVSEYNGVRIVVDKATPQGLVLHLENDFGAQVGYDCNGAIPYLQVFKDGQWQYVATKEPVLTTLMLGTNWSLPYFLVNQYYSFSLLANDGREFLYGELESGQYRFILELRFPNEYTASLIFDWDSYYFWAEFEIS